MSTRWLTWSALVVASLVGGVACGPLDEVSESPAGVNVAALAETEVEPPSRRECDYRDPNRLYISRSPRRCATIMFQCVPGTTEFNDVCGCGCEITP
jgi:hypothetical protein